MFLERPLAFTHQAVRESLGVDVIYRTNRYLNNLIEQDHRGMKQRYYPMRGFGSFESAARFCPAADEVRHYFRYRKRMGETVPLAEQRRVFRQRWDALQAGLMAT